MSREFDSKAEAYIKKTFAHEDASLCSIAAALKSDGKLGINVGAPEGKLLQLLVGLVQPKLIVEIGMLYGYSTLWMARGLGKDGKLISIEKSEENYNRASELLRSVDAAERIELRRGDAREVLQQISVEVKEGRLSSPDFVFIDADKVNYKNYLDWAMQELAVGGVIIGDNTFLFGHMIGEERGEKTSATAIESMTYFNNTLANAKNFRAAMIPTYEGMTVAQRLS